MKALLPLLLLLSVHLNGFGFGGLGGILNNFFDSMNSLFENSPPVDSWETTINDITPPDEEDRNITTKTVNKPFILSLGSLNFNNSAYEKKEKGNGANHNIELSVYSNSTLISNTLTWDPTKHKHTNSAELTPTTSVQDAQIRFYMCASVKSPSFRDLIMGVIRGMNIFEILDNFFTTNNLKIYPLNKCHGAPTDCDFSVSKKFVECYSTNHFAIKPESFSISDNKYILSGNKQKLDINATQFNSLTSASGYSFTKEDYALDVKTTKYLKNNTIDNTLKGKSSFIFEKFDNGVSSDAKFDFNDTAKVKIQLIDKHWASIDNDTPQNCNGSWICGEFNSTIIPHHFNFTEASLFNKANQTFTYLANKKDMQAHIQLSIEAQNKANNITENFDKDSWENPISIKFTLPQDSDSNKTEISFQNIGFENGKITLSHNDTTLNKHLSFNYKREVNKAQNPFMVKGSDVTLVLSTLYGDNNITATSSADKNATFLYARTNTLRTRVNTREGNATVYYEIYCNSDTTSSCDLKLLPDSTLSTFNNDPRWFNNTKHLTLFGNAGVTTQKKGADVNIKKSSTGIIPDYITLQYNGSSFPYKTTMQNKASSWLIYNKYNLNTDKNEFEVEFEGGTTTWVGKAEDNVTSTDKGKRVSRTNRRTLW